MGFLWGFMCHLVFFLEAYAAVVPGGRDAHLPETRPTDFLPVLKNRNEKAQQTMKKKRVYLRSRWVLQKKKKASGGWKRGRKTQLQLVPGLRSRKAGNEWCWREALPFRRHPAGTGQHWAGASPVLGKGFPSHSCSQPPDLLLGQTRALTKAVTCLLW